MRLGRRIQAGLLWAGLLGAVVQWFAPTPVHAAQAEGQVLQEIPAPARENAATPVPEDYVRLEVRESDLILTNTSGRPINAWSVKKVVRTSQGQEAYSTLGIDAYRSSLFPDGEERLLQPGESITLEKGGEPWLREDLRGPGSGVYYQVGAVTFEGGEAVGDPQIVERIFARRLDQARTALAAIRAASSAAAGDAGALDALPPHYRQRLEPDSAGGDRIGALHADAWADYRIAVANLRSQDRQGLPSPEEVRP